LQSDNVVKARPTVFTENGGDDVINRVSTINAESRALSKFTNKQVNVSSASTVDET